jgi:hypothetical protein
VLYFLLECLDVGGRARVVRRLEVLAGLVRIVREGHVSARRVDAERPVLYLGHVPRQAKQAPVNDGRHRLTSACSRQAVPAAPDYHGPCWRAIRVPLGAE